jgi:hypothetical protein
MENDQDQSQNDAAEKLYALILEAAQRFNPLPLHQ